MNKLESKIVFDSSGKDIDWVMRLDKDGIHFNRDRFPNANTDDFALAVVEILERNFDIKFMRKEPPYDLEKLNKEENE